MALKLRQGQIWKRGDEYLRIVQLERLAVGYKSFMDPTTGEGQHLHTTKKEFCRLLKTAVLLPPTPPVKPSPPPAPLT